MKKLGRWTSDELRLLIDNYESMTNDELVKLLNRPYQSVYAKASSLGLKKANDFKLGNQQETCEHIFKWREETPALADIICFYHRRNMTFRQIAVDVRCPIEQVEYILERCKTDGSYEQYAKQENSCIEGKCTNIKFGTPKPKYNVE